MSLPWSAPSSIPARSNSPAADGSFTVDVGDKSTIYCTRFRFVPVGANVGALPPTQQMYDVFLLKSMSADINSLPAELAVAKNVSYPQALGFARECAWMQQQIMDMNQNPTMSKREKIKHLINWGNLILSRRNCATHGAYPLIDKGGDDYIRICSCCDQFLQLVATSLGFADGVSEVDRVACLVVAHGIVLSKLPSWFAQLRNLPPILLGQTH